MYSPCKYFEKKIKIQGNFKAKKIYSFLFKRVDLIRMPLRFLKLFGHKSYASFITIYLLCFIWVICNLVYHSNSNHIFLVSALEPHLLQYQLDTTFLTPNRQHVHVNIFFINAQLFLIGRISSYTSNYFRFHLAYSLILCVTFEENLYFFTFLVYQPLNTYPFFLGFFIALTAVFIFT